MNTILRFVFYLQANLIKQQSRLGSATTELDEAQAILDDKQKELDVVQALYDSAMTEKQVSKIFAYLSFILQCTVSNINFF